MWNDHLFFLKDYQKKCKELISDLKITKNHSSLLKDGGQQKKKRKLKKKEAR